VIGEETKETNKKKQKTKNLTEKEVVLCVICIYIYIVALSVARRAGQVLRESAPGTTTPYGTVSWLERSG